MSISTDEQNATPQRTHGAAITENSPVATDAPWRRICLATGGGLFAFGNLLHPLQHNDAAYDKTTWPVAHLVIYFSLPLIILGLPALQESLNTRLKQRTVTATITALTVGLIGIAPSAIIETFVAPMIGHARMDELASGGMAIIDALGGIAFLGGSIVLGWLLHKAELRPRWAGPTLLAAGVVMLPMIAFTGPVAGAIVIASTAAYGVSLAALAIRTELL